MVRLARKLNDRNVRAIRLNWRGCGAGAGLARFPYHSGRSDDLAEMLKEIHSLCAGAPVTVIGFSLGGNVALKFLGEPRSDNLHAGVDRAIAVCPPIDLHFSVIAMQQGWAKIYDRYFSSTCTRDVQRRVEQRPDTVVPEGWLARPPRSLYEFDETFTAPVSGFLSAADYYARSSAGQFLPNIPIPTRIIAAQDDPLIPFSQFRNADYSPMSHLLAPRHGGHLGFCTLRGQHWLDDQIVQWSIDDRT